MRGRSKGCGPGASWRPCVRQGGGRAAARACLRRPAALLLHGLFTALHPSHTTPILSTRRACAAAPVRLTDPGEAKRNEGARPPPTVILYRNARPASVSVFIICACGRGGGRCAAAAGRVRRVCLGRALLRKRAARRKRRRARLLPGMLRAPRARTLCCMKPTSVAVKDASGSAGSISDLRPATASRSPSAYTVMAATLLYWTFKCTRIISVGLAGLPRSKAGSCSCYKAVANTK